MTVVCESRSTNHLVTRLLSRPDFKVFVVFYLLLYVSKVSAILVNRGLDVIIVLDKYVLCTVFKYGIFSEDVCALV